MQIVQMITGVAGFIGSNLAGALIEKGYKVVLALSNMSQALANPDIATLRKSALFSFYLATSVMKQS